MLKRSGDHFPDAERAWEQQGMQKLSTAPLPGRKENGKESKQRKGYCYHHDIETLLEKAREIASRHRQGELKWPVRAFQRWLIRNYGREAT